MTGLVRRRLRSLMRSPTYTAVSVGTLAVGIGATVAVFGVVEALVLQPLSYEEAHRLIQVTQTMGGEEGRGMAGADIALLRERVDAFDGLAWFVEPRSVPLTGGGRPEVIRIRGVSTGLFDLLGEGALLGRTFQPDENQPGRADVAVLEHDFWQRRFAGDPTVVGRTLDVNDRPTTVVGVLPASFRLDIDGGQDLFVPRVFDPSSDDYTGWFRDAVVGRLAEGVSLDMAAAELAAWGAALEEEFPNRRSDVAVSARPLAELFVGDVRDVVLGLFAAVALVFVIGLSNLTHLALARVNGRTYELAVRSALGAGGRRIVVEQLVESGLVALAGVVLGVGLATILVPTFVAFSPADVPGLSTASVGYAALAFATALGVVVTLLLGIVPALLILPRARARVAGGRPGPAGGSGLRAALVAGETAMVAALLFVAGLLWGSLRETRAVDPGFDTSEGLAVQLTVPSQRYPEVAQIQDFYGRVMEGLRALPGVTTVGATSTLPLAGEGITIPVPVPEGVVASGPAVARQERTGWDAVTPEYFDAMGIPILEGRPFDASDAEDGLPVIAVNQAFARAVFDEGEPVVGRRVVFGTSRPVVMEVVALVGDVRHDGLREPPRIGFYQYAPETTFAWPTFEIVIRARDGSLPSERSIRQAVREVDPDQPVSLVRPLSEVWRESMARARFEVVLLGLFSTIALLLGVVGIYGVVSHAIGLRRVEMGVRMALGAGARDITASVLARTGSRVGAGLLVGLALGVGCAHLVRSALFGVTPTSPGTGLAVAVVLLGTGLIAAYLPARRAGSTDPVEVLRG